MIKCPNMSLLFLHIAVNPFLQHRTTVNKVVYKYFCQS